MARATDARALCVCGFTTARPPPHCPEAKPFLSRALNTYFEGEPEKWNFEHEDKRFRGIVWAGGSKVIDRLSQRKPRLRVCQANHTEQYDLFRNEFWTAVCF